MNFSTYLNRGISFIRSRAEKNRFWYGVPIFLVLLVLVAMVNIFVFVFSILALIPGYEKFASHIEPLVVLATLIGIPMLMRRSRPRYKGDKKEKKPYRLKHYLGVPAFVVGVFFFWFVADFTGRVDTFPIWDARSSGVNVNWWVVSILGIMILFLGPIAINQDFEKRWSRTVAQVFGVLVMLHLLFFPTLESLPNWVQKQLVETPDVSAAPPQSTEPVKLPYYEEEEVPPTGKQLHLVFKDAVKQVKVPFKMAYTYDIASGSCRFKHYNNRGHELKFRIGSGKSSKIVTSFVVAPGEPPIDYNVDPGYMIIQADSDEGCEALLTFTPAG